MTDPLDRNGKSLQLYDEVDTMIKGGIQLKVWRCVRGSTSLESFHLHINRFRLPETVSTLFVATAMVQCCPRLVLAKARVVPLKPVVSLPRLELMGALWCARLTVFVREALRLSQ